MRRWFIICFVLVLCLGSATKGEVLSRGDRLAILGDSITQQKKYSKFMETYLAVCRPDLDIHVMQFGWSGETAGRALVRMERDLIPWRPDVVTTCYGMNDGGWRAYQDWIGQEYETATRAMVRRLSGLGATIVVGAPGVVDVDTFRWSPSAVNDKLARLGSIAGRVAREEAMPFADVHTAMAQSMAEAKAVLGHDYHVAGEDGVHPAVNGHLVMACVFLKALGMDGDIGTIYLDWEGDARATEGHEVLAVRQGRVELQSTRYPFCFDGRPDDPGGTVSMLPFVPFQEELNRFMLVVTNLPSATAEVKWGRERRVYTREELAEGISLAADFLNNPFCRPFRRVMRAVARKQHFETLWVWGKIRPTHFLLLKSDRTRTPEEQEELRQSLEARQAAYWQQVKDSVKPVRHTISVRPLARP